MSPLESCPNELVHTILKLLDLDSIRNLRLTCKTLATKCSSSHHCQAFFRTKHVQLTDHGLREFVQDSQAGGLRCLLENMIVSGIAGGDASSKAESSSQRVALLSQLFNWASSLNSTATLPSLTIEVAMPPDVKARLQPANSRAVFDWKPVWKAAIDAFQVTFRALAASKLRIGSLNIFNGPDQQRCSLSCEVLGSVEWGSHGLAECLSSLRTLSMSISNRVFRSGRYGDDAASQGKTGSGRNHRINQALLHAESNFTGLASFLRLSRQLECFELHYFCLRGELGDVSVSAEWSHEKPLQYLAGLDSLPNLTRCSLRGIYARETDLLSFITRTKVCELSLENVILSSGTFTSIFDYCTSAESPIAKLSFAILYEGSPLRVLVHFDGPGVTASGYGAVFGDASLARCADDVKLPIKRGMPLPGPSGSPALAEFLAFQRREYGST